MTRRQLSDSGLSYEDAQLANEIRHWMSVCRILKALDGSSAALSLRKKKAVVQERSGKTTTLDRIKNACQFTLQQAKTVLKVLFACKAITAFRICIDDLGRIIRTPATRSFAALMTDIRTAAKQRASIKRCLERAKEPAPVTDHQHNPAPRALDNERSVKLSQAAMQALFRERRRLKEETPRERMRRCQPQEVTPWQEAKNRCQKQFDWLTKREHKNAQIAEKIKEEFRPANAGAYVSWRSQRPAWMPERVNYCLSHH